MPPAERTISYRMLTFAIFLAYRRSSSRQERHVVESQYASHRYCSISVHSMFIIDNAKVWHFPSEDNIKRACKFAFEVRRVLNVLNILTLQFGNCGTLEQHGFARNKIWTIDEEAPPLNYGDNNNNKASVDILLKPSEDDLKCWPHWYDDNYFDMVVFELHIWTFWYR